MLFQEVIFWILAVVSVMAALGVVILKDIFRAALLLVVVFLSLAGLFILLRAEFLAVVQVLIYAGAISILVVFAITLTRDVQQGNLPSRHSMVAIIIPIVFLLAVISTVLNTQWNLVDDLTGSATLISLAFGDTSFSIGRLIIEWFTLPFGAVALLLLASIVGALSLVRSSQ